MNIFTMSRRMSRRKYFQIVSAIWIILLFVSLRITERTVLSSTMDLESPEVIRKVRTHERIKTRVLNNDLINGNTPNSVMIIEKRTSIVKSIPSVGGSDIGHKREQNNNSIQTDNDKSGTADHGSLQNQAMNEQVPKTINNTSLNTSSSVEAVLTYGPEGPGIDHLNQTLQNTHTISEHQFEYFINPANFCRGEDLLLIVYIHSSPKHFGRRKIIRRTWGNPKPHDNIFKVLFVVGFVPGDEILQKDLIKESQKYGDVLQENFIDSYKNLTHKGIGALKWIDHYCHDPSYVLKTDDDTFVNMFTYIRYIKSLHRFGTNKNLILCAVWYGMTVLRKGKWGVEVEKYNSTSYPTYCSGCAFTLTMDVARAIHKISYHVPFFWVDDAYISGILPRRIGNVTFRNFGSTYELNSDKLKSAFTGDKWWSYIFSSDIHKFEEAEEVWTWILKQPEFKKTPS